VLEELLPSDDVDVALDLWIFAGEPFDVCLRQRPPEAGVELSGELGRLA
jgi:hypothetical protein